MTGMNGTGEPAATFAYSFSMPASDVSVAATLSMLSGYCGKSNVNSGRNVTWSFDPATGAFAVSTNAAAVGTDFSMADYAWTGSGYTPWGAFKPYIRSVSVAPGVASIGNSAFCGYSALATVSIGGDVARIGDYAFKNCSVLEAVSIPGSVTSIGDYAFEDCSALGTVEGGANVTRVGAMPFGSLSSPNNYTTPWLLAQPAGAVYLGKVAIAFQAAGAGQAVEIAAGTVSIAESAFWSAPVTSVVIPESVAHIGIQAFAGCDALRAVYLLPAAPPELDNPDILFTGHGGRPNPDLVFYVRGTAYADAWEGVWDWMENDSNWSDANRIVIGTVACASGISIDTANSGTAAVTCCGTNYYAAGTALAVSGAYDSGIPAGYTSPFIGYAVNDRPMDGLGFLMPDCDAAVTPRYTVVDFFEAGHAGTENDPYIIYNRDQLDLLSARVKEGNGFTNTYFKLGADIAYNPTLLDENGENYTPIGVYGHNFYGNFDGDGHTVSGIRINKTGKTDTDYYQGLFGVVYNGTLRGIVLADSVIVGYENVGGIVGYHVRGTNIDCRVESSVVIKAGRDGAVHHGGIVGYNRAPTIGCLSSATITSDGFRNHGNCGGIVGIHIETNIVKDCFVLDSRITADLPYGIIGAECRGVNVLSNNYYTASTLNANTYDVGWANRDIDGASYAFNITLGEGVRIVGEETAYRTSGLTAIGDSVLRYVDGATTNLYSGRNQSVKLAFDGVVPEGFVFAGFNVTTPKGKTVPVGMEDGVYRFTMPVNDVTATARFLSPWSWLQAMIDKADGATVVLDRDCTAASADLTLTITNAVTLDLAGHTIDAGGRFRVIEISDGGHLTLTNSAPASGSITGGNDIYAGGVHVNGGRFTMTGGEISGNTARYDGGGVYVEDGEFTVSGSPVVSGNTILAGSANNVRLSNGKTIAVSNLAEGASIGVTTYIMPTAGTPVSITTDAADGDSQYFFSDNPNYSVGTDANGQVCLTYGLTLPAYMQEPGVPENFKTNWVDWARRYGANTNAEYEAAFLLDISPMTEIAPTSSLLRIVDFRRTGVAGYRFELASDACNLFQPAGDEGDTVLCNGALALEVATNLSAFTRSPAVSRSPAASVVFIDPDDEEDPDDDENPAGLVEKATLPVPVVIDSATGHAVIDLNIFTYMGLDENSYIPSFISPPPTLFFRPVLTPIYPDPTAFFLLLQSP